MKIPQDVESPLAETDIAKIFRNDFIRKKRQNDEIEDNDSSELGLFDDTAMKNNNSSENNQNNLNDVSTTTKEIPANSSATKITSPINTIMNSISGCLVFLKIFNPINILNYKVLDDGLKPIYSNTEFHGNAYFKHNSVTPVNYGDYNLNATLSLANMVVWYFSKVKLQYYENLINPVDVTAHALNIITAFQDVLIDLSNENFLNLSESDFNPIALMSELEKAIINGDVSKLDIILFNSINDKMSEKSKIMLKNGLRQKFASMLI